MQKLLDNYLSKIDLSKLKRNYLENPLKKIGRKKEIPYKEDLLYLYHELNFPCEILYLYFKCDEQLRLKWWKLYNIEKKSSSKIEEARKLLYFYKTGYYSSNQNPEVKEKKKLACLEKYGTESTNSLEKIKQKQRNTVLNKYHVSNVSKSPAIRKKIKKTILERYKVENISQNEGIKKKKIATCLKNRGTSYPTQSSEVLVKVKKSFLEHYGVPHYFQSDIRKEKSKLIIEKQLQTKIKNNSFNVSKPEIEIQSYLKKKFPDVIYQYKDKERYPFLCDFYIPSKDLFIEYQGFCSHGGHPFDSANKEDLEKLEKLKSLASTNNIYRNMLIVWTVKDPAKRKIAKENKLNYLEFFNMNQFLEWFDNYII